MQLFDTWQSFGGFEVRLEEGADVKSNVEKVDLCGSHPDTGTLLYIPKLHCENFQTKERENGESSV